VNDHTREHVIAVAARLNYRPNRIARGLVTGRSHSLGLVVSDIQGWINFFGSPDFVNAPALVNRLRDLSESRVPQVKKDGLILLGDHSIGVD
jgi:hypothetical protein